MSSQWEQIAQAKRQQLQDSIPSHLRIPDNLLPPSTQLNVVNWGRDNGYFTQEELTITDAPAGVLLQKLASQTYTSEQVTRAFLKKAAAAHQLTNCLTLFFWEEALERAKALDAKLKETGKTVGPLHGLPVSLKDNFNLTGKPSTVGFTAWANDPATYDSTLVTILRDAGAVFYCKTNVPTAMMIPETVNNLFGRTVNPLNRDFTSGGSSGGESALIAFGGSPLGVGTDIGGSLRIPASCTSLYTLRPSFGRFPTQRARSGLAGQEAILSVNGPMSRSLYTLSLFAQTIISSSPWTLDPKCLPIPWRTVTLPPQPKLKFAVLWDDGVVRPTPPVRRALRETVEKLRAKGHEVVEWKPTLHPRLLQIMNTFFTADAGATVRGILNTTSEPWRPEMRAYSTAPAISVAELWKLQAERSELQRAYLEQWENLGIDAILCPTTPYASAKNGDFKYVGYTGVFNVLDYSCTSWPCGINADGKLDVETEKGEPYNDIDKQVRATYDAKAAHGLPVSLQLVARRLEEEKVLGMTRVILQDLGQLDADGNALAGRQ